MGICRRRHQILAIIPARGELALEIESPQVYQPVSFKMLRSEFLPELATLSFETWLTRHNKLSISQSNPRRSLRSAPV